MAGKGIEGKKPSYIADKDIERSNMGIQSQGDGMGRRKEKQLELTVMHITDKLRYSLSMLAR